MKFVRWFIYAVLALLVAGLVTCAALFTSFTVPESKTPTPSKPAPAATVTP